MIEQIKDETTKLIEQAAQLKQATETRIKELLKERTELEAATAKRQAAISLDLRQLGYKPTRIKRTAKSETKAVAAK